MPKLFVFGIGGTGARVIKSLTMLLASGMRAGNFEVIPVLIDPHKDLKELNSCKTLLKLYSNIQEDVYRDAQQVEDGFFQTKVTTLASLYPGAGMKDDYDFDERHTKSFSEFVERDELPAGSPTRDLLSLLYTQENFNQPLNVGFKGNPNIGSIVLNSLKDSAGFKAFENVFGTEDRIFIISSIFGGTGASGFPLLLKNLRNHSKTSIKESQIGALTVLPYFKLTAPDGNKEIGVSDIDSNNFLTKTKAALSYYTRRSFSSLYNALYYIADSDQQNKPYENNEKEQVNKAHLVEVLGALSVLHFAKNDFQSTGNVLEYGLSENAAMVDFTNVADETRKLMAKDLTSLYLFYKLHFSIKRRRKLPFRKTCAFDDTFFNQEVYKKMEEFFNKYYVPWLQELEENERSFSPITHSSKEHFHALVKGYETEPKRWEGILNEPFDVSDLHLRVAKAEAQFKKLNQINKNLQYMSMCRKSTNDIVDAKIKF